MKYLIGLFHEIREVTVPLEGGAPEATRPMFGYRSAAEGLKS